ncbi:hypothetical protein LJR219_004823 [Phenylobacterium sp. LjRoot219]|uniref:hypothetical protein n=1 Tax=Phenylobacterium sp. LjRoot219 TaxID=3342283 RepID=UPI003ED045CC
MILEPKEWSRWLDPAQDAGELLAAVRPERFRLMPVYTRADSSEATTLSDVPDDRTAIADTGAFVSLIIPRRRWRAAPAKKSNSWVSGTGATA